MKQTASNSNDWLIPETENDLPLQHLHPVSSIQSHGNIAESPYLYEIITLSGCPAFAKFICFEKHGTKQYRFETVSPDKKHSIQIDLSQTAAYRAVHYPDNIKRMITKTRGKRSNILAAVIRSDNTSFHCCSTETKQIAEEKEPVLLIDTD